MQFYTEYVLGLRGDGNKKADKGTITHKILEITALCKKASQEGIKVIDDEDIGEVFTDNYDPEYLNSIAARVYEHYIKIFDYHVGKKAWTNKDFEDCVSWAWKALKYRNGMFDPRNRDVVDAEPHFDFEIDKPWAKYNYEEHGLSGNLALKGTIDLIADLGDGVYEVIDWKGLPLSTPLPTPDGFTTMRDIEEGDIVFDQYGKECRVVGKSKVKIKDCFRITFDDKTSVVCDDEHLWKLSNGNTVPVQELKINDNINVTRPLDCKEKDLPIDPYLLGVWLGDGRNRSCEISSGDGEIFKNLKSIGLSLGKNLEKRSKTLQTRTVLGQTKKFRKLNLLNNKHIPEMYFRASFEQRLSLLRGLMDTDGNVNKKRKQAVFTTCNKRLSDDVKNLLLTLGQRPNQSDISRNTNFKKDVRIFPIAFRPIGINPFLLSRKQCNPEWGPGKSSVRRIISIEKSITQKTQCISVDSKDNTYLCTENYIPTHNTGQRKDWATGKEYTQENLFDNPQLRLYHYACKHMYPDVQTFLMSIYFINQGGPFTVHYQDSDLERTEEIIRKRFEYIRDTKEPKTIPEVNPKQGFFCKYLCHCGMTSFEDSKNVLPIVEKRPGQRTKYGETMTKCEQIRYMIKKNGIEWVTENYIHPDHTHGRYGSGGGKVQD
jgi:hypothetical protein